MNNNVGVIKQINSPRACSDLFIQKFWTAPECWNRYNGKVEHFERFRIMIGRGSVRVIYSESDRVDSLDRIRSWRTVAPSSSLCGENSRGSSRWYAVATSTCFSGNSCDYVFLNVMYFTSGSTYFRAALAPAPPCRFCYSYLLFHALLTFYAACPSPAEPPLKYHVENNSLSNSHFSLRGWFRRNMHETEASEVENGKKKRWCDEKFGDS